MDHELSKNVMLSFERRAHRQTLTWCAARHAMSDPLTSQDIERCRLAVEFLEAYTPIAGFKELRIHYNLGKLIGVTKL